MVACETAATSTTMFLIEEGYFFGSYVLRQTISRGRDVLDAAISRYDGSPVLAIVFDVIDHHSSSGAENEIRRRRPWQMRMTKLEVEMLSLILANIDETAVAVDFNGEDGVKYRIRYRDHALSVMQRTNQWCALIFVPSTLRPDFEIMLQEATLLMRHM